MTRPATTGWQDAPPAPGTWAYKADPQWPVALFGQPGAQASVAVRCDHARRRVLIQRAVVQPFVVGAMMTISTSAAERTYATTALPWAPAYLTADLAAEDPQLDAIAFSRGKFLIALTGQSPVVLPSWVELSRIIEDCRG